MSTPQEDLPMPDAPTTSPPVPGAIPPPRAENPLRSVANSYTGLPPQQIHILPGSSDTAASFEFQDEDHTLGNALRWIIMKNPEVEFCAYSIPHPSEAKMNVRIQTYGPTTALQALEKGLDDLMQLCDVVMDKFIVAKEEWDSSNPNPNHPPDVATTTTSTLPT